MIVEHINWHQLLTDIAMRGLAAIIAAVMTLLVVALGFGVWWLLKKLFENFRTH